MSSIKMYLSLYLVLAVILSLFSAAYFYSKGRASYRRAFSGLIFCISIYLFGYLMLINSENLREMIFWNQIQYLGLPFIPVLWMLVALLYTKTVYSLKRRISLLLFAVPILTFFVRFTNAWHHLFYTNMELRSVFGYPALHLARGIWYYVNITYTILCMLMTVIIYLIGYARNKAGYTRNHFFVFLFASLLPFIGILLILLTYDTLTIDFSALTMPVSLLIISYGVKRFDFLEIKTLARETIFENNFAGMVVLGPGKRIIDYNKAAERFFGKLNIPLKRYPLERVLDRDPKLLEIFESESSRDLSVTIDGEERFFEIDAVPLGNTQDKDLRLLKSIRDVTEERKIQDKLKLLATTDALSGLYNRAEFLNLAQKEFALAVGNQDGLALLIMDLDHFKSVNDTFGHAAGDEVIREMGRMILSNFRKTDVSGRIGGEEFAVVLKNASLEEAKTVAEKFRQTVADKRVVYGEREIRFTVSIGVAAVCGSCDDMGDLEDLLKKADDALYRAKAEGRNRIAT